MGGLKRLSDDSTPNHSEVAEIMLAQALFSSILLILGVAMAQAVCDADARERKSLTERIGDEP